MSRTGTNDIEVDGTIDDSGIIPFADELPTIAGQLSDSDIVDAHAIDAEDLCESAHDEFGDSQTIRRSVVDTDLGLGEHDGVQSSKGKYACPCCGSGARRVVRVRVIDTSSGQKKPRWVALCAVCAASMLSSVPGTIVGGSVRPSRRKRSVSKQAKRARGQDAGFRQAG
mgnify:FL=1